jgi:hypothetical protein
VNQRLILLSIAILILVSLTAVPVLAAVSCPMSCSCLLPAEAKKLGYPGYCGGKQQVCAMDAQKNEKYCYTKPVTATTVVPQLIVTGYTLFTTTPTPVPVPVSCPSGCSCYTLEDGKKNGLSLCSGTKTLCGSTPNQQPKYCHGAPVTGPTLVTGINMTGMTVTTTALAVQPQAHVAISDTGTGVNNRVAAAQRCTISGRINGFWHNRSSLRVRFTREGGGSSDVYTFPAEGPIDAVTPVLTYLSIVPCSDSIYDIEPVYVPDVNVCPWTGTFTPARITGVRTNDSSVTGQDFTFSRTDTRVPEVEIFFTPPEPAVGEAAWVTVRGRDDSGITAMSGTAEWRYNDGSVQIIEMHPLVPEPEGVTRAGELPAWSDTLPYGAPWYRNLNRVIVNAKVCDAAGNEGRGRATLITGSCDDNFMNRDEEQIDCGGTRCAACIPCTWCGPHVTPLRIAGSDADKIDVVFVPDADYGGDMTQFTRNVQDTIVNAYYRNDAIEQNRSKFNFYYLDDPADASGYPACGFTPPLGSCEDFQDATPFADSIAIVHKTEFRDWSDTKCERRVFLSEPTSYRTFVHESGHSVFGLKDEYCCDSHYAQQEVLPNIWSSRENCRTDATAMGWDPDDCTNFCPAGSDNCGSGFWSIDPDDCIMGCSQVCTLCGVSGMCQYEQACLRRVNDVFSQFA